ncbi:hypothetical protein TPA0910_06410 [Streptomyces hygroscopicus subsp. sporocinereus]|uniref:Uncharacterized protein n=1 Tax=Streptomyces hygroscopicus TaxID=1912 RepID=A0ABQ3TS94_STRHY|nr:hypothetical protein TPA0910_06410 [Streptomyces hygroscopicus]
MTGGAEKGRRSGTDGAARGVRRAGYGKPCGACGAGGAGSRAVRAVRGKRAVRAAHAGACGACGACGARKACGAAVRTVRGKACGAGKPGGGAGQLRAVLSQVRFPVTARHSPHQPAANQM